MFVQRLTAASMVMALVGLAFGQTGPTKEEILTKKDEDRRDLTLLRRTSENVFAHEGARVSFAIPKGWTEIRPYRLDRKQGTATSTVLGIERAEREWVATLYWLPLPTGARAADWIRSDPVRGEYGEEFETLKAVYGKGAVSESPKLMKFGSFDVYKVSVKGGPDRGDRYSGALYIFEVGTEDGRWLCKIRVSFPKEPTADNERQIESQVLAGYTRIALGGLPISEKDKAKDKESEKAKIKND